MTSDAASGSTRLSRRERWRAARQRGVQMAKRGALAVLGPGLITGASDDDPSGIATYSQAGAAYGFGLLWVTLFTIPLMAAIQEISARIGRVTGRGLARNMRLNYPRWFVDPLIGLLVLTNIANLGADINAMGEAVRLVVGGPRGVYAVVLTAISLVLQTVCSYKRYTGLLKYGSLVLLVYVATMFVLWPQWGEVLKGTVTPWISLKGGDVAMVVALLGTTISPYLFFWQASLESEGTKIMPGEESLRKAPERARPEFRRIRLDTYVGMLLSNFIAFSIMVCTAGTLHVHGATNVDSAAKAAEALGPLSPKILLLGKSLPVASILFSLGIIAGGMLAIPVLAGSGAYAIGELFRWPVGLERTPGRAKGFYAVLIVSTVLAAGLVLLPINPMKALVWAAIANGVAAVPVMVVVMLMAGSERVMGHFAKVSRGLRLVGWLATAVMGLAAAGMFWTMVK